jgi:hypothetical protein
MRLNADNIKDYADTVALQARGAGRILDYSPESLDVLEESIRLNDNLLKAENFPEKQRNLLVFYNGCYLGETMAQTLNGVWMFEDNWYESSLLIPRQTDGVQVRPFEKILRRLTEGPEGHDLGTYFRQLKSLLAEPE